MPSYKDEKTGKWYCTFRYTDLTGKRVQKMKRGFALKRDAEKWERDFLSADIKEKITIGQLTDEYIANLQYKAKTGEIRTSTLGTYLQTIRLYITPYWKDIIFEKVKPVHVTNWISKIMSKSQYKDKARLSSGSINKAKCVLKLICDYAILNHGFYDNPVAKVKSVPYYSSNKRAKLWSPDEYRAFSYYVSRQDMRIAFDIMFYAGLRIGEVLALTPADIDKYTINVNKTFTFDEHRKEIIGVPKTRSSIRKVQIPVFLYKEIDKLIESVLWIKKTDLLFTFKRSALEDALERYTKKAGNPKISPHILRHSYASYMLTLTNPATVAKQLGHSTPAITLDTYSHMMPGTDREAADKIDNLHKRK